MDERLVAGPDSTAGGLTFSPRLSRHLIFHPSWTTTWLDMKASPAAATAATVPITYIEANGTEHQVDAEIGKNLMQVAHDNNIELEGAYHRACVTTGFGTLYTPCQCCCGKKCHIMYLVSLEQLTSFVSHHLSDCVIGTRMYRCLWWRTGL
jgi:hypothetical protein